MQTARPPPGAAASATSIRGAGLAAVNFQALPIRFSSTTCRSWRSAWSRIPGWTQVATWRPGSLRAQSSRILPARLERSTGSGVIRLRLSWDIFSRPSMSWPMRWVPLRMRSR